MYWLNRRVKRWMVMCCLMMMMNHLSAQCSAAWQGPVRFESEATAGIITVEATGRGNNLAVCSADASAAALYLILFRGLPGSQYNLPMISNENDWKESSLIQQLLKYEYHSFILSSDLSGKKKLKKKKDGIKGIEAKYRIAINCDALRRYLEENDVIKKMGAY